MPRLRDALDKCRAGKPPEVLPRLTTARTAMVIADRTGEDPSKILARLDAEKRRAFGKREAGNRHALGTVEFAVRYAVSKLGMARVSEILGVSSAVLYKAINPSEAGRRLPDLGVGKVVELARALRKAGHAEFFSTAIQAQAQDAEAPPENPPSLHHRLTRLMMSAGDVARAVALATDPDSEGGEAAITPAQAAAILDMIAAHGEVMRTLQADITGAAGAREATP